MTVQRQFVIEALQRLQDPGPLDPVNHAEFEQFHIDKLHGQHEESLQTLALDIDTSKGARHAYLFTGTIGSGKSTELRKLAQKLRDGGNAVIVINAQDYLNPQFPLSIVELLVGMALGVWEYTAERLKVDPSTGDRFSWWSSLFKSIVEPQDVEVGLGLLKLKGSLQSNPTFRERMRKHNLTRLDALVTDFGNFMDGCAEQIRSVDRIAEPAKCVLVVDSLEHFGGHAVTGQPDEVFKSLQQLFNTYASSLRIPSWSVIYSVPPLLAKLAPGIANTFGSSNTCSLSSAHVFLDRTNEPDDTTINNKLLPLVNRRLGEDIAYTLIEKDDLRNLIIQTGGDLRDLLRTVRAVVLSGLAKGTWPVTKAMVERVLDEMRRPYLPLPSDTRVRLQHVNRTHEVLLNSEEDWPMVIRDLAQKRILLYLNGTEWYGVHPLLREHLGSAD